MAISLGSWISGLASGMFLNGFVGVGGYDRYSRGRGGFKNDSPPK